MLKRRIIPKLQMRASRFAKKPRMVLVTTRGFGETVEIGDPVSQARIYEAQAADELVFLDLDASADNRSTVIDVVRRAAEEIFMPFTVGGGVRTVEDFRVLLANGADKVSVNTAALERPELITEASAAFGAQCVVLSVDYRRDPDGADRVYARGGAQATGLDPAQWAARGEALGAGEILLTCIDRDGSREGLDLEGCRRVAAAVSVPVIVSGGCGAAAHFVEGFARGGADAVAAGTYFSFKDENILQIRSRIVNAGIPVRQTR
ncbi:imidazole glycerol phosphate synthase subunit HisF [Solidesulfovibrio alcoholivorans]|uniref:imidazole glycerol phosphate synthase subunit HisF n=1 Tax=Solidesulfovibrio alcoholivorans TaxID=81406 RepID=UPI0004977D91|nr:imidazole glycerol phosphate synthase cyclase subunit [Solidesulfovibrio alcoholivorans]